MEESGAEIATGKPPAAELACTDKHASAEPAEFSSCTSTGEDDSGELGGAASPSTIKHGRDTFHDNEWPGLQRKKANE